jgi:hypothetical protein
MCGARVIFSLNTQNMQTHVRTDVMRSVGPVVTSDWLDVSCLSLIPVVVEACLILG